MDLFFETIFVGVLSFGIFVVVRSLVSNSGWSLFMTGVLKHFVGYWIGIQDAYCRQYTGLPYAPIPSSMELLLEGFAFVLIGGRLQPVIKNPWIIAFGIGVVIHLAAEWTGVHAWFLRRCS
jgi:hypothetical protein